MQPKIKNFFNNEFKLVWEGLKLSYGFTMNF